MSSTESAATRPPLRGGRLALLLGVDLKTLHNWHRGGKLPARKTLGGQLIFEPAAVLDAYEAAKAQDPAVEVPDAFAEYMRTGSLPAATPRRRKTAAAPRAKNRRAA